jgi:hypothetical protein
MKSVPKDNPAMQAPRGGIRGGAGKDRLPPAISRDAVARAILDSAEREQRDRGAISGEALDGMLKRAMEGAPGQMSEAATQAIDHVLEHNKLGKDAEPLADIVRHANRCRREGGTLGRDDVRSMMKRAWDKGEDRVSDTAATAIRYVGWRDADIMDAGAKELMTSFVSAWYSDMVESPAVVEGRKQLEAQLAQDKRDFTEFVSRDKTEHKRHTLQEFKKDLKENRVEASEWQTLMLWLQTGQKQKPVTS